MWTHTVAVLHMNKRLIIYGTEAGNGQRQVSEWGQRGTAQQSNFFFLLYFTSSDVDAKVGALF